MFNLPRWMVEFDLAKHGKIKFRDREHAEEFARDWLRPMAQIVETEQYPEVEVFRDDMMPKVLEYITRAGFEPNLKTLSLILDGWFQFAVTGKISAELFFGYAQALVKYHAKVRRQNFQKHLQTFLNYFAQHLLVVRYGKTVEFWRYSEQVLVTLNKLLRAGGVKEVAQDDKRVQTARRATIETYGRVQ